MSDFFAFDSAWLNKDWLDTLIGLGILFSAILIFDRIIKAFLSRFLKKRFADGKSWGARFLSDRKLFFWVSMLPYLAIVHQGLNWIPHLPQLLVFGIQRIIFASFILISLFILSNISRIVNDIYIETEISRSRPIKGYLQGILIIAYILGFILMLAVLFDKSPLLLLSGLGAMTAILMLVFKDTILSFVAGVQLTSNDLVRVGDWIEMPQFNADGDVVEIALNNVKVQNWDKTVTVIPAHKFLESSFKNWRGMQESGGRRIKRNIMIDVKSIRFLTADDIAAYKRIKLLQNYLDEKAADLAEYNKSAGEDVNQRRLTNVGTFRAYLSEYLRANPYIHKGMTFLVRQLQPGSEGLPIEIYVFTNDTRWAVYEGIQADIFDHLLAIMPEFDLKLYQRPSGHDVMLAAPGQKPFLAIAAS